MNLRKKWCSGHTVWVEIFGTELIFQLCAHSSYHRPLGPWEDHRTFIFWECWSHPDSVRTVIPESTLETSKWARDLWAQHTLCLQPSSFPEKPSCWEILENSLQALFPEWYTSNRCWDTGKEKCIKDGWKLYSLFLLKDPFMFLRAQ